MQFFSCEIHTSFLITDKLEAKETKPIQSLLKRLGLPPNPPVEASGNFSWEDIAGRGRRMLGLNVLLSVQIAEDVRNTSRNRVVVGITYVFLLLLLFVLTRTQIL